MADWTAPFDVLAERVAGVRRLPRAGLQASLPTLTDVRAAYLKGIAPDGTVVLSRQVFGREKDRMFQPQPIERG